MTRAELEAFGRAALEDDDHTTLSLVVAALDGCPRAVAWCAPRIELARRVLSEATRAPASREKLV